MAAENDLGLDDLDRRGGEWLRGGGARADTVISSRVRLARNLAGFPFLARASDEQRQAIVERVRVPCAKLDLETHPFYVDVDEAGELLGSFLVERHLISRELQQGRGARGVAFGSNEAISVMVNEEDHVRIQSIRASLALREAWQTAVEVDRALESDLDFAATSRFGYLTACPTNVGTGLRASVMLHLPAMVQMKQIEKLFNAAHRTGLAVRGFYGEGTMASGDLYQISNQVTLGVAEDEVLDNLETILPTILDYERRCREELLTDRRRLQVEDRCHRALGLLRAARVLSSEEAMANLSTVRLGLVTGVLEGLSVDRVNELFVLIQPAHIQKMRGETIDASARDAVRASFVRQNLG